MINTCSHPKTILVKEVYCTCERVVDYCPTCKIESNKRTEC